MQDPQETAKDLLLKDKELSATFSRLFNSSDGMVVLGHLNNMFFISHVGPNQDHAYHMGQKDLMAYILSTIQQGKL